MRRKPNRWETELASFNGLQLIARTTPHTYFDLYFYGNWIAGHRTEAAAWSDYYRKVGS